YPDARDEPSKLNDLAEIYAKRRRGVTEDNFICFPGTQTTLFAVMTVPAETGDGVRVGNPLNPIYECDNGPPGPHPVMVPLRPENRFHLQAEDLERAVTPQCRAVLLNTPHNPTGAVLTADEIAAIGEVCRKHDLWIVCDEVYEQLVFDDASFA